MIVPTLFATTAGQQLQVTYQGLLDITNFDPGNPGIPADAINGSDTGADLTYGGFPLAWLDLTNAADPADTVGLTISYDGLKGIVLDTVTRFYNISALSGTSSDDLITVNGVDAGLVYGSLGSDKYLVSNPQATLSYAHLTAGVTFNLSYVDGAGFKGSVVKAAGVDRIVDSGSTGQGFVNYVGSAHDDLFVTADETNSGTITNFDGGGADGSDTISFANWSDAVTVNLELGLNATTGGRVTNIGTVIGTDYDDLLTANHFGSTLEGGLGSNTLIGGTGNDLFIGGAGRDKITGGGGDDTVSYAGLGAGIVATLPAGALSGTVSSTAKSGADKIAGVTTIIGTGYDDVFSIDANAVIGLNAGAGHNSVSYALTDAATDGDTRGVIADFAQGRNLITQTALTGFESVYGSTYDDQITAGSTGLFIYGDLGVNTLFGGAGDDTFQGGLGQDKIDGKGGTNYLTYYQLDIQVDVSVTRYHGGSVTGVGKSGIDRFDNIDWVVGSTHDDTFTIANASDANGLLFYAGAGHDTLTIGDSSAGWTTSTSADYFAGSLVYYTTYTKGGVSFKSEGIEQVKFTDQTYDSNYHQYLDLNGDDKPDLLFNQNFGGASDVWWTHLRDGVTTIGNDHLDDIDPSQYHYIGWGNVGAHTKSNLYFENLSTGNVQAYVLDGTQLLAKVDSGLTVGSTYTSFGSVDTNGDHVSDFIFQDSSTGKVYVSTGGGTTAAPTLGALSEISGLDAVTGSNWVLKDVATNSRLGGGAEFAFQNTATQEFRTYNVVGNTASLDWDSNLTQYSGGVSLDWQFVKFADLDGNGTEDFVFRVGKNVVIPDAAHPGQNIDLSGLVYTWTLNADGKSILTQGTVGNPDYSWSIVQVADYTADGKDDLLFLHAGDGVAWYWSVDPLSSSIASQGNAGYFENWHIV